VTDVTGEFRVVVTGSRTWKDYGRIYRRLAELGNADHGTQMLVVIHGDAPGADTLADRAARDLGYHVRKYPADWTLNKKMAGKDRNTFMLRTEQPQVVLAFWEDDSPGTGDCIEKALDQGLYVEIHER
jgi:hypothetical protein